MHCMTKEAFKAEIDHPYRAAAVLHADTAELRGAQLDLAGVAALSVPRHWQKWKPMAPRQEYLYRQRRSTSECLNKVYS